ncbi:hypothetical protein GCM10020367_48970 [Streptomyces sannanensis]|uniref:EcsC family protein n=1 Tax=Streptomyces sannanensis TaxID=285536 RepID=A0ABP6SHF0_9ACTN
MAGATPPRKRLFHGKRAAGVFQGGTGRTEGVTTPSEPSALPTASTAPGERDDRRGRPASLGAFVLVARKGRESTKALIAAIADRIIEAAPRVRVRDLAALRAQFPGLGPEEIADKLIVGAARGTSTVGASIGAAAMLPTPPVLAAELATEIVGVALIELKLVAELHEVYGLRPQGGLTERSLAYVRSWTEERGIDVTKPETVNVALGGQMKRELRHQITKRMVRNLPNLIPFLIGAAVGAVMNRRDTRKLAARIRKDLRKRQIPWDALPNASSPPAEELEY